MPRNLSAAAAAAAPAAAAAAVPETCVKCLAVRSTDAFPKSEITSKPVSQRTCSFCAEPGKYESRPRPAGVPSAKRKRGIPVAAGAPPVGAAFVPPQPAVPAPPVDDSTIKCAGCHAALAKSAFSKNQLSKAPGSRRCKTCCASSQQQPQPPAVPVKAAASTTTTTAAQLPRQGPKPRVQCGVCMMTFDHRETYEDLRFGRPDGNTEGKYPAWLDQQGFGRSSFSRPNFVACIDHREDELPRPWGTNDDFDMAKFNAGEPQPCKPAPKKEPSGPKKPRFNDGTGCKGGPEHTSFTLWYEATEGFSNFGYILLSHVLRAGTGQVARMRVEESAYMKAMAMTMLDVACLSVWYIVDTAASLSAASAVEKRNVADYAVHHCVGAVVPLADPRRSWIPAHIAKRMEELLTGAADTVARRQYAMYKPAAQICGQWFPGLPLGGVDAIEEESVEADLLNLPGQGIMFLFPRIVKSKKVKTGAEKDAKLYAAAVRDKQTADKELTLLASTITFIGFSIGNGELAQRYIHAVVPPQMHEEFFEAHTRSVESIMAAFGERTV